MFGIALSSSSPAVAARCGHARSSVGAVTTQNITDPRLGPAGLAALANGASAETVINLLRAQAGATEPYRQLTVVDSTGHSAAFSGHHALGRHGHHTARDVVAAGNMLANLNVPQAMADAFASLPEHHIADRLLAALDAAIALGGEEGPVRSAGLLVVDDQQWPLVDLRVDWNDAPIAALGVLWQLWQPQMRDYVTRGLDPSTAPSYGVPGDP
jgi:uncharacterized Ntn-hydrolase superfamily protein